MPDGPSSPARGEFTGEPEKYSNVSDEAESGLALKMSVSHCFLQFSSNSILSSQSIKPFFLSSSDAAMQCFFCPLNDHNVHALINLTNSKVKTTGFPYVS